MAAVKAMLKDGASLLAEAFRRGWRGAAPMLVALAVAEGAVVAALAPLSAGAVNWLVQRTGQYAVANDEIVRFALTWVGVATLLVSGTVALAVAGLGRAAALMAAMQSEGGERASGLTSFLCALWRAWPILSLSARQVAWLAAIAAPFVAMAGAIAWLTVRNVDLYWLVNEKPARFWIGLACMAPALLAGAWFVVRRAMRWSIALPLCVLSGRPARAAMRESEAALRGRVGGVTLARLTWLAIITAIGLGALMLAQEAAEAALRREWGGLTVTALIAGIAILAHGAVAFLLAVFGTLGDSAVVYAAWKRFGEEAVVERPAAAAAPADARRGKRLRLRLLLALGAGAVVAATSAAGLIESAPRPIEIEITAHRGASRVAPENTLPAITAAIDLGADRVEIDAMLSADGALVLFHDVDLRRIARDPRRIADMTLEELREVDAGAWFAPEFAGERMPTLSEALDAVGGRAGLNIELKAAAGGEERLAEATAAALRAGPDGGRRGVIITSLSTRALAAMRRADPEARIGLIVTASIGDLRRMDADLLAVESRIATRRFIGRSEAAGLALHVWGVADPDLFTRLALQGVEGVITSDPAALLARRAELQELTEMERLLLAFRVKLLE